MMANLPSWLRAGRPRRHPETGTVTVTLTIDTNRFVTALRAAAAAADQLGETMHRLLFQLELAHIRMETKWYMRGGLDPAYATPDARDAQVKELAAIPMFGAPGGRGVPPRMVRHLRPGRPGAVLPAHPARRHPHRGGGRMTEQSAETAQVVARSRGHRVCPWTGGGES